MFEHLEYVYCNTQKKTDLKRLGKKPQTVYSYQISSSFLRFQEFDLKAAEFRMSHI